VTYGLAMVLQWQPWASLLVYGIKKAEGRTWSTTHRGRLWIAAAAKKPDVAEIEQVITDHLAHYRTFRSLPCWQ